jgi:hypothetical protein
MRFSKKEILISIALIVVLFSFYLYSRAAWKNLDASFNPEREKLGLPLIETYFVENDKKDIWYNPDSKLPRHAFKDFSVKTQSRTVEHDEFQFLLDGDTVSLASYYHHNGECFNLYLYDSRLPDKGQKKLICPEFNSMLKANGFTFQLTKCKECEEK